MLSTEPKWVAVYTNPRAEKKVDQNLQKAGFESYLPLRRELHTWSDRKKWVEVPLIKSYVFTKIKDSQLEILRHIYGVSFVVSFKGNVATIPDFEIDMMKNFLASELNIQIRATEQLRRGRKVRINSGPYENYEGMLVSDCEEGNFAVNITGISMSMIIHIDQDLLEVVSENEEKKTKKYTIR